MSVLGVLCVVSLSPLTSYSLVSAKTGFFRDDPKNPGFSTPTPLCGVHPAGIAGGGWAGCGGGGLKGVCV